MLDVEIVGSEEAIAHLHGNLTEVTNQPARRYAQKGADGFSGLSGLVIPVVPGILKVLIEFVGRFVQGDRGVTIKVEGLELSVRNIKDASDAIALLSDRGLLPKAK